mgnify:CR=1 FL=1
MMKLIRYSKANGALNIGGLRNKLTILTRDKCARLHLGRRTFHFGDWR